MKRVSILGSTGSIGVSTLDVIAGNKDEYAVTALAGGRNMALLKRQIEMFRPRLAVAIDERHASELRTSLGSCNTSIAFGVEGYREAATIDGTDMVVSAMVGASGLIPTMDAIDAGRNIALANKETLVMAGGLVLKKASRAGVKIIPVDSEHSAIFQCIQGHRIDEIRRIILTASGGPFLDTPAEEMAAITPQQALKHPNWEMGKKITIDSATMMNKGLEVIEAAWLFDTPVSKIEVLVHPQSIVHSLVEYNDGSVLAQMGIPDMRIPISYALSYPRRMVRKDPFLDLSKRGELTFMEPDNAKFPALGLAYAAARAGGTAPAVLNAANEVAVGAFIENKIGFSRIAELVETVISRHQIRNDPGIGDILTADSEARADAVRWIEGINN